MKKDENELRSKPIDFASGAWAYEETNGLSVYTDKTINPGDLFIGTIPLRTIRAYLKRIDAKRKVKK